MRAVILEADERMIAERHRLGQDKKDEMWKGVLHMVPPASQRHQNLESELHRTLWPAANKRGLRINTDNGMFAAANDYRIPDLVVFDPAATSRRGIDGPAELVIEIRSPGDESSEKVPWYLERGTKEVLLVDRDTLRLELHTAAGQVEAGPDGTLRLASLGVTITPEGDSLRVDGTLVEL